MNYDFIATPDAEIPRAAEPVFQHLLTTYASEANKTASVWRAGRTTGSTSARTRR